MALPPVIVRFLAQGVPDVQRAFRSISDTVTRGDRGAEASARRASSSRVTNAEREAREKIAAWRRADAFHSAALRAGQREAERFSRAEVRAAESAAAAKMRIAARLATEEQRLRASALRDRLAAGGAHGPSRPTSASARLALIEAAKGKGPQEQKAILGQVREMALQDRAHSQGTAQAERAAAAQARIVDRSTRDAERARERGLRSADRAAKEEVRITERAEREKARAMERWGRERDRNTRERVKQFSSAIGTAGTSAMRTIGRGAAAGVAGLMQVGGGFGVVDSVQKEVQLRGQAAQLAASSEGNFTADSLLNSARAVATTQAMNPEDVLHGYDEVKKMTGDLGKATRIMPQLAKIATATGANLGEVGGLAGNILASNEKISDEDLLKQVRLFTQQGIVGGVELGDFAKFGGRIIAGASLFGGNREENEGVLGAAAQIARQKGGAASPAEATLAAQRFGTDIQKHAADLEAQGIKVRDGKGTLRSAKDISLDMLDKTGGDVTKLSKLGIGDRGVRVLTGVADIYREAGGGKAGRAAVEKEFSKYTTGISESAIETKNKQRLAEVDAQLTVAMNNLRAAVGTSLVPELTKLIPQIARATPIVSDLLGKLIKVASWAEENPFAGFAGLVTAFFMKELINAQIANTIKGLITGGAPGGGVGGLPGGAVPAATPAAALGLAGLGAAVQLGSMAHLADQRYGAVTEGKEEAAALAQNLQSEDPVLRATAERFRADAQKQGSKERVTAAYVDTAVRGVKTIVNPLSSLGDMAGDWVTEKVAGKGKSTGSRSVEALKANEIVNAPELQSAVTKAIADGVREGVKQSGGIQPGPEANPKTAGLPISSPQRLGPP